MYRFALFSLIWAWFWEGGYRRGIWSIVYSWDVSVSGLGGHTGRPNVFVFYLVSVFIIYRIDIVRITRINEVISG